MGEKIPILIVEDDHDMRVCFREILESKSFLIHSATNGKDALFLLQNLHSPPKLIISDLSMPLMDGNQFIREKNKIPALKDIPVLVVSAYLQKLEVEDIISTLPKPLDIDLFVEKIQDCLK